MSRSLTIITCIFTYSFHCVCVCVPNHVIRLNIKRFHWSASEQVYFWFMINIFVYSSFFSFDWFKHIEMLNIRNQKSITFIYKLWVWNVGKERINQASFANTLNELTQSIMKKNQPEQIDDLNKNVLWHLKWVHVNVGHSLWIELNSSKNHRIVFFVKRWTSCDFIYTHIKSHQKKKGIHTWMATIWHPIVCFSLGHIFSFWQSSDSII